MTEHDWEILFRDNLERTMIEEHMNQRDLARVSGLSESSISNYMKGKKIPSIRAIINLSYALNCSTDELINFGDYVDND